MGYGQGSTLFRLSSGGQCLSGLGTAWSDLATTPGKLDTEPSRGEEVGEYLSCVAWRAKGRGSGRGRGTRLEDGVVRLVRGKDNIRPRSPSHSR